MAAVIAASAAELEMAHLLVSALSLEDVTAEGIDPDAPLFGTGVSSLGLDSIDALEIALSVEQKYGVELRADDQDSKRIFSSLRNLCAHVQSHRKT